MKRRFENFPRNGHRRFKPPLDHLSVCTQYVLEKKLILTYFKICFYSFKNYHVYCIKIKIKQCFMIGNNSVQLCLFSLAHALPDQSIHAVRLFSLAHALPDQSIHAVHLFSLAHALPDQSIHAVRLFSLAHALPD